MYYRAKESVIVGDVRIGEDVGIWYHATIRADAEAITIGRGSNVQDNAVVHVDPGHPVIIGEDVTIGHGAIVHGCRIGDGSLIGMGAILLNEAVIGKNCLIGAGALVTGGMQIPDNSLVFGNPAKVIRPLSEEEIAHCLENSRIYVDKAHKQLDACV